MVESAHKFSQSSTAARGGHEIPQNADFSHAGDGVGLFPVCLGATEAFTQDRIQEDVLFLKTISRTPSVKAQALPLALQQLDRIGIDFVPTERFLQFLTAAGASEEYLAALRACQRRVLAQGGAGVPSRQPRPRCLAFDQERYQDALADLKRVYVVDEGAVGTRSGSSLAPHSSSSSGQPTPCRFWKWPASQRPEQAVRS